MNRNWYLLGVALLLAAIIFHQPLLAVLAFILEVMIGAIDIWDKFCLRDIQLQRHLSEQKALFGEQLTLSLSIENAKLLPLPWVEVEERIPESLGLSDQYLGLKSQSNAHVLETLFSLRWYERVTRRYSFTCGVRGVHTFGPTLIRSGDLFGFISHEQTFEKYTYLLVYPLILPLARFGLPSRHPFGMRRAPRRLLEDPSRVIGVRDYQFGDDLRRVHWKASARSMQLQSKIYEDTTTYNLLLFLNMVTKVESHYGVSPELEELGICVAASIAEWALNEGYAVGLHANSIMSRPEEGLYGILEEAVTTNEHLEHTENLQETVFTLIRNRRVNLTPASSEEQRRRIMEALARIQSYFGSNIEAILEAERRKMPVGTTVVVITPTLGDKLLDTLLKIGRSGHTVTILLLGDRIIPMKLPGITFYNVGGEETWRELVKEYLKTGSSNSPGFKL